MTTGPDRASVSDTKVLVALLLFQVQGERVTLRGLADRAGVSVSTLRYHLNRLRSRGLVEWTPGARCTLVARLAVRVDP